MPDLACGLAVRSTHGEEAGANAALAFFAFWTA